MSAEGRPPDVVGSTLDDARARLAAAGWGAVEVTETRPPRRVLRPPWRVVRQRVAAGGRVLLVICGEHADPAERDPDRGTPGE